jgi:eukaryotic-like serine/threonine-protein kinase
MSLASGAVVGPYEVLERLAGGGMGEVYRARDLRLGREVALKVLPLELQADAALSARFTQEAQSASALNHRNIVTVYDVGEQGPLRYIAMELVSGRTFRELLVAGPLPGGKCLELAIQIVEGLAAAHERSVVHRDIKPENLMLTPDGVVKILDFGLARVTTPVRNDPATLSGGELATSPGTVLGTAGYM